MNWSEYQEHVAAFFRSLGLDAQTDVHVEGARSGHDIDVVVKFSQYGVDVLWIVECKYWKTAIPKEKVVALQHIAQDVGADRAFLISEHGFQAGAIRAAQFSNMTLSSVEDLEENSRDLASSVQLAALAKRFSEIDHQVSLWFTDSEDCPGPRACYRSMILSLGVFAEAVADSWFLSDLD